MNRVLRLVGLVELKELAFGQTAESGKPASFPTEAIGVRLAAIRPQKRVAVARNKTEVVRLESRPGYQTAPESGKGQLTSRDIGDESSGH